MFERKLKALGYLEWDKVNANDTQHFRKVIVWLEEQKIRHYKIEDRKQLRDVHSDDWPKAFQKYCEDVKCAITNNPVDQLEWFLGYAVWLKYVDNCSTYQRVEGSKVKTKKQTVVPNLKSTNPLDNLEFNSKEFIEGVNAIAKLLKIPCHPNHLVTLEACSKIICRRLNANAVANPNFVIVKGKPFPLISSDFPAGDKVLQKAANGLTLLYIQDLRDLQTKINETIVAVQSITANPKTDTTLGKVGK